MSECYYCKRNVTEKFYRPPSRECAMTLLANKAFCGGGVLILKDDKSLTTDAIENIAYNYALNAIDEDTRHYRIRKLVPIECFRLMGVKDEDYKKVAENQSDSSLYHLAGDSIVTDVLMAIFKQVL